MMNRKPSKQLSTVSDGRTPTGARRFPRRQATLQNLLPTKKFLNLRNVFTIKNFAWVFTWSVCFAGAFFQSIDVVKSFLKSETTTSIEYIPTSDLPAITICFDKSDLLKTDNVTIRRTINQLEISQQLNFTYNYTDLFTSCSVVTLQENVNCHELLTITHFVTFDSKCISIHEPRSDIYRTKIKNKLLLNHTHIYTFALNKTLIGGRFDLTIHNITHPLQILDQNWVKLSPDKYASAKISFKHIHMSLLPAPHDTNCSYYEGDVTKANCLNKCFIEEYFWKENKWPPYVPGFNKKKKTLTDKLYFEDSNSTDSAEKRSKRQIAEPTDQANYTSTLSPDLNIETTTIATTTTASPTTQMANLATTTASSVSNTTKKPAKKYNPRLNAFLEKLKKQKSILGSLHNTLFVKRIKLTYREEFELNTKIMSDSILSIKGIPDIRGHCDFRCDRGQECHEDIYKPVRETEIEASSEELAQSYVVEIQPSKYVFRCLTFEKYKRVHLACFIASTITLWFGGSIFFLVRHLIKGNLATLRCLFCWNNAKSNAE